MIEIKSKIDGSVILVVDAHCLYKANLREADLRGADLRGADLDFTSWPLWCGGTNAKLDDRIACQLAYHAYNQDYQDPESLAALEPIRVMAQRFIDAYRSGDAPALRAPWTDRR